MSDYFAVASSSAGDACSCAGLEFNCKDERTDRNRSKREAVSVLRLRGLRDDEFVSFHPSLRCKYVPSLTVLEEDECDKS
jgi:hypothetical protein